MTEHVEYVEEPAEPLPEPTEEQLDEIARQLMSEPARLTGDDIARLWLGAREFASKIVPPPPEGSSDERDMFVASAVQLLCELMCDAIRRMPPKDEHALAKDPIGEIIGGLIASVYLSYIRGPVPGRADELIRSIGAVAGPVYASVQARWSEGVGSEEMH